MLQGNSPPKMWFFLRQKVQILLKFLWPKIRKFNLLIPLPNPHVNSHHTI